jgi:predicted deacylase
MQVPLEIISTPPCFAKVARNSRRRFAYTIMALADGTHMALPIMVIAGATAGPRLVCVAGVHGNEHEGITALYELWNEIPPDTLKGTIVMVPVANPPAFRAGKRRNPDDLLDMNRVFPGAKDGTITERLAYHLFHDIVQDAQFVLSMHGFPDDAMVLPYTEYPCNLPVTAASRAAACAFGLEYIEAWEWPEGLLVTTCTRAGIPAIEPEIGGLGYSKAQRRQQYKTGVANLLAHLGMHSEPLPASAAVHDVQRTTIRASTGGVLYQHCAIGHRVCADEVFATILDLTGGILAEVRSPTDGIIAAQRLRASVNPGEMVGVVFTDPCL